MRALRHPRFWLYAIAGSLALALVEAGALHFDALRAGRTSLFDTLLLERVLTDAMWVLIAAVVCAAMTRTMSVTTDGRTIAVRFALLGLVLAPLHTTWSAVAHTLAQFGDFSALMTRMRLLALTGQLWDFFIYTVLTLICYAVLLRRQYSDHEREGTELRARLAQMESQLLLAQSAPQFLLNPLDAIPGLPGLPGRSDSLVESGRGPFDGAGKRRDFYRPQHDRTVGAAADGQAIDLRKSEGTAGDHARRLVIRSVGRVQLVDVERIDWLEASGNYVEIHAGKETFLHRERLHVLEAQLDPAEFVRIHRSIIVNRAAVKELRPISAGDYTVVLRDGAQVRLSRTYRSALQLLERGS